jgi:hypothetical protein
MYDMCDRYLVGESRELKQNTYDNVLSKYYDDANTTL